jgi:hypothetical protein
VLRFLAEGPVAVRELAKRALLPESQIKMQLGCLERWRFVTLQAGAGETVMLQRDGWGSGRGIRAGWLAGLTPRGRAAVDVWPPLAGEIERRWRERFGADDIARIRQSLEDIACRFDQELPHSLPGGFDTVHDYPARTAHPAGSLSLPVLLSQVLLAFTIDFDAQSRTPLRLCAGTIRVLGEEPVPVSDIPRLTGSSPETSDIGWQLKPYVALAAAPQGTRGKVARLTPLGLHAQQTYRDLTGAIEKRWSEKFGGEELQRLRVALFDLFVPRSGERLLLAEGLIPHEGTIRSGAQGPALGRRDVGSAALQRARDMVAQSEQFQRDPAGSLPHYPQWDMNRGFGP